MGEEVIVYVWIFGAILIPLVSAFGHSAGWWDADLGGDAAAAFGWPFIMVLWPLFAVVPAITAVVFLVVGVPVIVAMYFGEKLKHNGGGSE